jgi:hypothetical protein
MFLGKARVPRVTVRSAPPGRPGFCALQRPPEYFPPLHPGSRRIVEPHDTTDTYQDPYQTISNTNDALTITPADLAGAGYLSEALTFLVLDDDPLTPYDVINRRGGTLVLLYHFDGTEDNFVPTRPTAIGADYLKYPYTLPTPTDLHQLRKFIIAIPKITVVSCQATDPLSGQVVTSNSLTVLLKAPAYQLGPFTVRQAIDDAGASIGTATYLTVDKLGQLPQKTSNLVFFQGADGEGDLFPKWPFRPGLSPQMGLLCAIIFCSHARVCCVIADKQHGLERVLKAA